MSEEEVQQYAADLRQMELCLFESIRPGLLQDLQDARPGSLQARALSLYCTAARVALRDFPIKVHVVGQQYCQRIETLAPGLTRSPLFQQYSRHVLYAAQAVSDYGKDVEDAAQNPLRVQRILQRREERRHASQRPHAAAHSSAASQLAETAWSPPAPLSAAVGSIRTSMPAAAGAVHSTQVQLAFPGEYHSMRSAWRQMILICKVSICQLLCLHEPPSPARALRRCSMSVRDASLSASRWSSDEGQPASLQTYALLTLANCLGGLLHHYLTFVCFVQMLEQDKASICLPAGQNKKLCEARRAMGLLVLHRAGVVVPLVGKKLENRHFLAALAECERSPPKSAEMEEALDFLERVMRDIKVHGRVLFETKGFNESGDRDQDGTDVQKRYVHSSRAFMRVVNWVLDNGAGLNVPGLMSTA